MTSLTNGQKVEEFQFRAPQKGTKWEQFHRGIYNPDSQQILGRTKKSWGQLLIFYAIFYACLAAFFAICMRGLLASLDDKQPTWQLSESLIGTNPGMGFRPLPKKTEQGSLISYNLRKPGTIQVWVDLMDEFLAPYRVEQVGKNYKKCEFGVDICDENVCTVELDQFGPCSQENAYGYNTTSPCVFLKLNRIYGWVPEYFNSSVGEMPNDLKVIVDEAEHKNQVWISCRGENPADREFLRGFKYYPSQGIPGYYFPFINNPNYLSPLIAVQVANVTPGVAINVECRAWARNIKYSGSNMDRQGSVHFEVMIDV